MRILFINTFDTRGGAAIVAHRLISFLEEQHDSTCYYMVANKTSDDNTTISTRGKVTTIIEKVLDRILNAIGLQYQFFPFSSFVILRKIKQLKPDIISLHNTHGGYFQTSLLKKISKLAPVVWTLHDMWSFTGNAAHTFGDSSWKELKNSPDLTAIYPTIGLNTGAFLLRQKRRIYKNSNLTIVTPSQWLFSLARQSPVFIDKKIKHINNGVDLRVFHPIDKNLIRSKLNIPVDAKVILFSSEFLDGNPWKGGKDLLTVLDIINTTATSNIHLIIVGSGKPDSFSAFSSFITHATGFINDEQRMAEYFSASDLFIYPTKADNLPNVLVEAIACGIPCITSNIGGCSEIIIDQYNGRVIQPSHPADMAFAITQLLNNDEELQRMSVNARAYAEQHFSMDAVAEQYFKLFHSLEKEQEKNKFQKN